MIRNPRKSRFGGRCRPGGLPGEGVLTAGRGARRRHRSQQTACDSLAQRQLGRAGHATSPAAWTLLRAPRRPAPSHGDHAPPASTAVLHPCVPGAVAADLAAPWSPAALPFPEAKARQSRIRLWFSVNTASPKPRATFGGCSDPPGSGRLWAQREVEAGIRRTRQGGLRRALP